MSENGRKTIIKTGREEYYNVSWNNKMILLENENAADSLIKIIKKHDVMREALEETAEQLEVALQRLGCCGHGDGKDRKADGDDCGGYDTLKRARQAIQDTGGKG